jgi:UDPglucose--hexose-1-phosphate uridylyltransferase
MSPLEHPHRRRNPLTGRWVLVAAGRTKRPWQGQEEAPAPEDRPAYDPGCYLCPGNDRAGGQRNPPYTDTFVFTNDYAALRPDTPAGEVAPHPLLRAHTQPGTCRVLCFSPRHDLTLAQMSVGQIRTVVDLWAEQTAELMASHRWVQVFENRGESMGASNPHPHGQVWASAVVPDEPAAEDRTQREHLRSTGRTLLGDYADLEATEEQRVVAANDDWLAVVPYWAVWPFETLVLPRRPARRLPDLDDGQRTTLAALLQELLVRCDNLFAHPFPYSMGWHGAPAGEDTAHWQLHAHLYPPLLRSATVRKFMVGYEMLADVQRDLTPEEAAERLRAQSTVHHLLRS